MALNNMRGELVRHGITQAEVANKLGMSLGNFDRKLSESVPMTVDEARTIRDFFLTDSDLDYLLESDGDTPTYAERELSAVETIEDVAKEEEIVSSAVLETIAEMKRKAVEAVKREEKDSFSRNRRRLCRERLDQNETREFVMIDAC